MDHEREIHQDIQSLHSDMQTLVYENYNKFILATDTIGKVIYVKQHNIVLSTFIKVFLNFFNYV